MRYKQQIQNKTESIQTLLNSVIRGIEQKTISPKDAINALKNSQQLLTQVENLIESE